MLSTNIENAVPTGIIHENGVPSGIAQIDDSMGPIQLVEEGVDPRSIVQGKVIDVIDLKTNKYGKAQRSVRVQKDDGNTLLVSGFGTKAAKLEGLRLGCTYSFKGKLKTQKGVFEGKERESIFLNI